MDFMPSPRELLRTGEPRRSRANHSDFFAGLHIGEFGFDPAVRPGAIDDRALDGFDCHRTIVNVQRASGFARCRTNAAGELRKIIRRMKIARSLLPIGVIDEVVPIRDLIVDRAAAVAKRNPAIHAACRLILGRFLGKRDHEFLVMTNPVGSRRIAPVAPVNFEESRYLAHASQKFLLRRSPSGAGAAISHPGPKARRRFSVIPPQRD